MYRFARLVLRAVLSLSVAGALAPSALGAGWGFTPSAQDWETWPQYCRVQYSYINRGQNQYGDYYPDTAIAAWRAMIGEQTFQALHHYCKTMIILKQLRLQSDPKERKYLIGVALDDGEFTYVRADPHSIVYPAVSSVMAEARFANGEVDEAVAILRRAIDAQPTRFEAYATLAKYYREQHHLDQAVAVVTQANDATHGDSAEIQYSLGLLNLELGNVDAAVVNATQAYSRGYPLAGLREKLAKLGRWPDKPPQ